MEEAKKQVEIVESHLRSVREEVEQSIALLMKTDGELKQTKEKLKETEGELQVTEGQLKVAKGALEEEVLVRQAYQVKEEKLDGGALGLKQVAAAKKITLVLWQFEQIRSSRRCGGRRDYPGWQRVLDQNLCYARRARTLENGRSDSRWEMTNIIWQGKDG